MLRKPIRKIREITDEIEDAMVKCQDHVKNELLPETDDVEGSEL